MKLMNAFGVSGKESEVREIIKNEVKKDEIKLQGNQKSFQVSFNEFQQWKEEINKIIESFKETKQKNQESLLGISKNCELLLDNLSKKIEEQKEKQILSENSTKEAQVIQTQIKSFITWAKNEKKELQDYQTQEKVYFEEKKDEIERAKKELFLDKLKIQSAQEYFEKAEKKFRQWEMRLESREQSLSNAFKEAKQKGIN